MNKFYFLVSSYLTLLTLATTPLQGIWNPFVNVSQVVDSAPVGGPNLDLNDKNNGVGIWATPDFSLIKASSYIFGQGWGPEQTISDTSTDMFGPIYSNQGDPTIAINNNDYVVSAWEGTKVIDDEGTTMEGIFGATRDSSGVWSPVQMISAFDLASDYNPENPFVDVNDSGLSVIVWTQLLNEDRFIMANVLPFGGSWGTPLELANPSDGFREDTPMVQINNNNNAAAVWATITPSTVGAATTPNPAIPNSWTTITLDTAFDINLPRVGIDENGNAVAVWVRRTSFLNPDYEVVSASFNFATQTWGSIQTIASTIIDPTIDSLRDAYVVVDQAGTATAVWTQTDLSFTDQVYASRLPLGGSWSPPVLISTIGVDNFMGLDLAQTPIDTDPNGNVIVIFETPAGLQSVAFFVGSGPGFGWQTPENIMSSGENTPFWTSIRFGTCGFALALWQNGDENTAQAADNFGVFPPPAGFNGVRCCQKFASQTRCLSLLEWEANPCAAFYQIRRNGILIATLPAGITSFADPVSSRRELVTYTITAFNIFGFPSNPISITVP